MATPITPIPDLSQYNYEIGDTVEVVTKQNALNAEFEALGQDINTTVSSINDDVDFITTARNELDANDIVHAPGSGLPNEAGTAYSGDVTTSNTDSTAGRLMKVGDFGLGVTGPMPFYPQDMDADPTSVPSGIYKLSDSNVPNSPVAAGIVRVNQGFGDRVYLEVFRAYSGGVLLFRGWAGSQWVTEWLIQYHSANILGTVSESGGTPTGAIIERGSNANGRYTKYADGTLICDNSNNAITTNPAAFVGSVTSIDGDKLRIGTWF